MSMILAAIKINRWSVTAFDIVNSTSGAMRCRWTSHQARACSRKRRLESIGSPLRIGVNGLSPSTTLAPVAALRAMLDQTVVASAITGWRAGAKGYLLLVDGQRRHG